MVTLTTPTRRNPEAPVIDPEAAVMSPAVVADVLVAEETADVFVPVHGDNFLIKMLKGVAAFYDGFAGPPMSKRDRIRREIAEAKPGWGWDRMPT